MKFTLTVSLIAPFFLISCFQKLKIKPELVQAQPTPLKGTLPVAQKPFISGEILTRNTQLYGKFVVKARCPKGSGIICAFFLFKDEGAKPYKIWEEIDIEVFGKDDAYGWQSTIIVGGLKRKISKALHRVQKSLAGRMVEYTIEWTPEGIRWLLDGVVIRAEEIAHRAMASPQSFRINLWPTSLENWAGPIQSPHLHAKLKVDWVEVYSYIEPGKFSLKFRDDFDYFEPKNWKMANWTFPHNLSTFSPKNIAVHDGHLSIDLRPTLKK